MPSRSKKSPDLADQLVAWRKARGLSQRGAADELGMSRRTLQQWEQRRQSPQGMALRAVLQAIGAA